MWSSLAGYSTADTMNKYWADPTAFFKQFWLHGEDGQHHQPRQRRGQEELQICQHIGCWKVGETHGEACGQARCVVQPNNLYLLTPVR
jgi:peroxidase